MSSISGLQLSITPTVRLTETEKTEIVDLCTRAFGEDFSSLFHFVQSADHVLARYDDRLVGHAVWSTRLFRPEGCGELKAFYVDGVATDPDMWGRGIGRAVMNRLVEAAKGYDIGGLSTDVPEFYRRIGWEHWLGPLGAYRDGKVVPTPGETVMIFRTPRTPPLDLTALLVAEWRDGQVW